MSTEPSFAEALRFWFKLGFISFGGPTGQIAIMHTELVEKKKWISEARFLHALNYCMLLPGPEAQQLATYIGWLLHKTRGGIAAGGLFVLPSVVILWLLSYAYASRGQVPWIAAIFFGLKPAVMAIVACAVVRIGNKALKNEIMWGLAAGAFVAIFFLKISFPLIIFTAALTGLVGGRFWKNKFLLIAHPGAQNIAEAAVLDDHHDAPLHTRPSWGRAVRVILVCLLLWWGPILYVGQRQGWDSPMAQQGIFFSKAAMVTFGGAYAVLPYVAQHAVEKYQWLSAGQMMDGLGLAETTPGPLIMVVQFVGFLGGWGQPGSWTPAQAATLCALISTWSTFLPCFLWIFLGAPHIEQLRGRTSLTCALSAVTAAVVGVVLNLAVWFGLHTLFPETGTVNIFALIVGAITFIGLWRWKWSVVPVVLGSGLAGLLYRLVAGGL